MKTISTVLTIMIISLSIALGQSGNKQLESEIQKLEVEYHQAVAKRDVATLDRLRMDDYLITFGSTPRVFTKQEVTESYKSRPGHEYSGIDDLKIRVHGDTVIAKGHSMGIRKTSDGKTTNTETRFTDVWIKRNGKWLLAASHASSPRRD